jgi:hypothetical protein
VRVGATCGRTARGSAHLNMQSRNHTSRRSLRSPRFASFALLYPIPCAFHHQFYFYHYLFPFCFTSSSSGSSNRKENIYFLPSHCIECSYIYNPLILNLNFFKFNTLYLCIGSINFCNISMYILFVMHLSDDGHISGRNI